RGVRRVTQNRYGRSREDVTRGGTLIITGRGPRKEWITHGERGCEFVRVRLSHRLFKAALGERGHSGGDAEIIDNFGTRDPAIEALLLQLLREFREDAFCSALCAEAIVQQIVVHLLRRYSSLSKVPDVRVQRLTPAKLARVTEYIDGNLAAELTTADVAAVVSMGAGHFAKCFRHTMGMTPHEFVAQKRIARARELLLEKERSIADIAYQVGFSAPSHFSTAFTRNVGITPRAYRRSASK
ncbi:MAG TPA: AraC family transcriptional regulator, partial [Steroidobacteraceae bacterium]